MIFLTLSPGSRVMLVPMPLVMRGVPAQIFFAVPEKVKNWVKTNFKTKKLDSLSTILCRSNLSLISLQGWTMRASSRMMERRRHNPASGPKGLIRTSL